MYHSPGELAKNPRQILNHKDKLFFKYIFEFFKFSKISYTLKILLLNIIYKEIKTHYDNMEGWNNYLPNTGQHHQRRNINSNTKQDLTLCQWSYSSK